MKYDAPKTQPRFHPYVRALVNQPPPLSREDLSSDGLVYHTTSNNQLTTTLPAEINFGNATTTLSLSALDEVDGQYIMFKGSGAGNIGMITAASTASNNSLETRCVNTSGTGAAPYLSLNHNDGLDSSTTLHSGALSLLTSDTAAGVIAPSTLSKGDEQYFEAIDGTPLAELTTTGANIHLTANLQTCLPASTSTYDLGSTLYRWRDLFCGSVKSSGAISGTTGTFSGALTATTGTFSGDLLPSANSTYKLGSLTNQWDDIFVEDINCTQVFCSSINSSGNYQGTTMNLSDYLYSTYIRPSINGIYSCGEGSYRWSNMFTDALTVTNAATIGTTLTSGNHLPGASVTSDLGSNTYKWRKLFSTALTDNGTDVFLKTSSQIMMGQLSNNTALNDITAGVTILGSSSYYPATFFSTSTGTAGYIVSGYTRNSTGAPSTATYDGVTYYRRGQWETDGDWFNVNGTYGAISDGTVKKDVTPARSYLEDVSKLKVVKFNWTNDDTATAEKPKWLGLVAQDVEQIFPGLVKTGEDGIKAVKMSILIPMLLSAVQELKQQIDTLKNT